MSANLRWDFMDENRYNEKHLLLIAFMASVFAGVAMWFSHAADQKIIDEGRQRWQDAAETQVRLLGIERALMEFEDEAVKRGHAKFIEHGGDPDDCRVREFQWNEP